MGSTDQAIIDAQQQKIKEQQAEIEELKKQLAAKNGGQPSTPPPAEKKVTVLTSYTANARLGKLVAGSARANLSDEDGEPIKGKKIIFLVDDMEAGTGITDANGDATMTSGQYINNPQAWVSGLGNGYTVRFKGDKEYLPSESHSSIQLTA